MRITLNGETYIAPAPKGRMVRRAYELIGKISMTEPRTQDMDDLVTYTVDLFGGQFTVDEFYDGIEAKELWPTLSYFLRLLLGRIEEKLDRLPNV